MKTTVSAAVVAPVAAKTTIHTIKTFRAEYESKNGKRPTAEGDARKAWDKAWSKAVADARKAGTLEKVTVIKSSTGERGTVSGPKTVKLSNGKEAGRGFIRRLATMASGPGSMGIIFEAFKLFGYSVDEKSGALIAPVKTEKVSKEVKAISKEEKDAKLAKLQKQIEKLNAKPLAEPVTEKAAEPSKETAKPTTKKVKKSSKK